MLIWCCSCYYHESHRCIKWSDSHILLPRKLWLTSMQSHQVIPSAKWLQLGWATENRLEWYETCILSIRHVIYTAQDQSRYAPSQWEMSLQCNDISHWLSAYLDWSLQSFVVHHFVVVVQSSSWIYVTHLFNSSPHGQNGHHFGRPYFKMHFL